MISHLFWFCSIFFQKNLLFYLWRDLYFLNNKNAKGKGGEEIGFLYFLAKESLCLSGYMVKKWGGGENS